MINRGMVPDPRPLSRPWLRGEPSRNGDYIVVDRFRQRTAGSWLEPHGWCIRGRWVGRDGALCYAEMPPLPEGLPPGPFDGA